MGLVVISVFFILIALLIVCALKLISLAFEGKVDAIGNSNSAIHYPVGSTSRMSGNTDDFYDNLLANTLNSVDF